MHRRSIPTLVFFFTAAALAGGDALARRNGGYDVQTVVAFNGAVIAVDGGRRGADAEVRVTIKTDNGSVVVRLGPAWFLDRQGIGFAAGDELAIVGSRISVDDRPAVLAAVVRRGDQALELRDLTTGAPKWRTKASSR